MISRSQKMKRQVWLASLILLVLTSAVFFVTWNDHKTDPETRSTEFIARSLRIMRTGFADMALQRDDTGQWLMSEPCKLSVNNRRLNPLLNALASSTHQYNAADVDLEAAGLTPPKAILVLNGQRIEIGDADLSGDRRYIMRGQSVQFAPEWILALINGGLSAIASPTLFTDPLTSLAEIRGEQIIELDAEEIAAWQSVSAQQIVSWPEVSLGTPLSSQTIQAKTSKNTNTLSVHHYQQLIAVQVNNEACAYIVPGESLPGLQSR